MKAPRLARWMLKTFGCGPSIEALTGDLIEECEQGRTRWWFWGQALAAIIVSVVQVIWDHKLLALRAAVATYVLLWARAQLIERVLPWMVLAAEVYIPTPGERFPVTSFLVTNGILTTTHRAVEVPWEAVYRPWLSMMMSLSGAVVTGWLVARMHGLVGKPVVLLAAVMLLVSAVPRAQHFLDYQYPHDGWFIVSDAIVMPLWLSPMFAPVSLLTGGWLGRRRTAAVA